MFYCYIEDDFGYGIYLQKLIHCLPCLIIIVISTIIICLSLFKTDVLNLNQYSSFFPKPVLDSTEYKNKQRGKLIKRDDRMMLYMFLKEGLKQDAIDYYVKDLGGSESEAIEIIEEYEKFL